MRCISCDGSSFVLHAKDSYLHLAVYRCTNCALCVTGDSEDEIKSTVEIYDGKYWSERNAAISIESKYTDPDSQGKRRNWISQYLYCKPYLDNKRKILEIGVGAGQTILWFDELGYNVTGIEPDKQNVDKINSKLRNSHCVAGYIENLHINDKFDVIWMSHVLEHLMKPDLFLQKIKNNLKQNGLFFIEVPNCDNERLLTATIKTQPHLFHFSKKSLINVCKKASFKIERCDTFRPATKLEGGLNKLYQKMHLKSPYSYYPRIIADEKTGRDLRILLSH